MTLFRSRGSFNLPYRLNVSSILLYLNMVLLWLTSKILKHVIVVQHCLPLKYSSCLSCQFSLQAKAKLSMFFLSKNRNRCHINNVKNQTVSFFHHRTAERPGGQRFGSQKMTILHWFPPGFHPILNLTGYYVGFSTSVQLKVNKFSTNFHLAVPGPPIHCVNL